MEVMGKLNAGLLFAHPCCARSRMKLLGDKFANLQHVKILLYTTTNEYLGTGLP